MKRLFSFIVLAGILTACQVERIETAYSLENAEATINVSVIDINTGVTPTEAFTVTANAGTVSSDGTTVTITGNPSIPETNVTITVEYGIYTKYEIVTVNPLSAGGVATYSVTIIVGEIVEEETYSVTVSAVGSPTTEYEYDYSTGGSYEFPYTYNDGGHNVDINRWYYNDSGSFLLQSFRYIVKTGSTVESLSFGSEYSEYQTSFDAIVSILENYSENNASATFTFSAYSYYNALVIYAQTDTVYNINLVNVANSSDVTSIGSFTLCTYSTSIVPVEGDYSSHGHAGHGNGYNSGGGIIISE